MPIIGGHKNVLDACLLDKIFHWPYETAFCCVVASSGSVRPTVYPLVRGCEASQPSVYLTHHKLYNQAPFLFQLFYT